MQNAPREFPGPPHGALWVQFIPKWYPMAPPRLHFDRYGGHFGERLAPFDAHVGCFWPQLCQHFVFFLRYLYPFADIRTVWLIRRFFIKPTALFAVPCTTTRKKRTTDTYFLDEGVSETSYASFPYSSEKPATARLPAVSLPRTRNTQRGYTFGTACDFRSTTLHHVIQNNSYTCKPPKDNKLCVRGGKRGGELGWVWAA